MSKHTKEPWTYVTADQSMIGERKFQIETLGGYAERKIITGWVSFDDARRIVACVNACRGIETETLENTGRIVPAETHAKKNPVAKVVFDTSKDLDGNVTKSRPQIFKIMNENQLMQFEPDTPLYSAPPDYAAGFAAGMMKAAEICNSFILEGPFSFGLPAKNEAFEFAANQILSAIPADSKAALREVCMKVAEKVCAEAGALAINTRLQKDAGTARYELNKRLEAIVNSVLEGKS